MAFRGLFRSAVRPALELSALVILQTQPLKGIFPPSQQDFTVQFQFFRTRQPLCLKLHTNYQAAGPTRHSLSFFSPSPPTPTLPCSSPTSHNLPTTLLRLRSTRVEAGGGLELPLRVRRVEAGARGDRVGRAEGSARSKLLFLAVALDTAAATKLDLARARRLG
jgi:hypothetical protein